MGQICWSQKLWKMAIMKAIAKMMMLMIMMAIVMVSRRHQREIRKIRV